MEVLSPLHFVVFLGFYLVPSSGTYSFSFCLTFCDCGFHSTGCRVVVPLASGVCPLVDEASLRGLCRLPGGRGFFLLTGGWSWILSLWWAESCQGMCLEVAVGSGGAGFPTCWVVWPEVSQHWSLQDVGWGQVKLAASRGAHTNQYFPVRLSPKCLWPHSEPQLPTSPGDPPNQQVGLAQAPMKSLLFLWVPEHLRPCGHPPRVEFLLHPVLWSSCGQALMTFKAKCSGSTSSWCQTPRLGSLTWGSELSFLQENLCDMIIFQSVGHPPGGYGTWFYHECAPPAISLWLLLCLWM